MHRLVVEQLQQHILHIVVKADPAHTDVRVKKERLRLAALLTAMTVWD